MLSNVHSIYKINFLLFNELYECNCVTFNQSHEVKLKIKINRLFIILKFTIGNPYFQTNKSRTEWILYKANNINIGIAIDGYHIALILRFQKLSRSQTQKKFFRLFIEFEPEYIYCYWYTFHFFNSVGYLLF